MIKLNIPVEEFTTPNPVIATVDMTVEVLQERMKRHGIRHLPIVHVGKVVGVVSERDLKVVMGLDEAHRQQVSAGDIMAQNPVSVAASTPLDEVAFTMVEHKVGSLIVNEDDGGLLGIFTVTDALNALMEVVRGELL